MPLLCMSAVRPARRSRAVTRRGDAMRCPLWRNSHGRRRFAARCASRLASLQCTCDRSRPRTNCRATRPNTLLTLLRSCSRRPRGLFLTSFYSGAGVFRVTLPSTIRELNPHGPSDNSYQCGKVIKCRKELGRLGKFAQRQTVWDIRRR